MIKVISGQYRGMSLSKLSSSKARPTLARVRKSILQILEPFEGKTVLDLFSGTGILGIESLSRGAEKLVSIENDPYIYTILVKNLNKICSANDYITLKLDVMKYLSKTNDKFDIIVANPPYISAHDEHLPNLQYEPQAALVADKKFRSFK